MPTRGRRKSLKITDSEWTVMNILWRGYSFEARGMTLGEISDEHARTSAGWSTNTVRTYLLRLADKGAVEIDKSTGVYKYSPTISREDCYDLEVDAFLKRVFENSEAALIGYIISRGNLTADEKQELISLLGNDIN